MTRIQLCDFLLLLQKHHTVYNRVSFKRIPTTDSFAELNSFFLLWSDHGWSFQWETAGLFQGNLCSGWWVKPHLYQEGCTGLAQLFLFLFFYYGISNYLLLYVSLSERCFPTAQTSQEQEQGPDDLSELLWNLWKQGKEAIMRQTRYGRTCTVKRTFLQHKTFCTVSFQRWRDPFLYRLCNFEERLKTKNKSWKLLAKLANLYILQGKY